MRQRRRAIRSRTLIRARRCLSAIEQSLIPQPSNAVALATVMAEMARTDIGLSAMLGELDGTITARDKREYIVRWRHDQTTRTGR